MTGEPLRGTVARFDRDVGLGEIAGADGRTYAFHCIEIADGTRDIPTGIAVEFALIPKLGRYEAARIRRTSPPAADPGAGIGTGPGPA